MGEFIYGTKEEVTGYYGPGLEYWHKVCELHQKCAHAMERLLCDAPSPSAEQVQSLIREYGYNRTQHVLAGTVAYRADAFPEELHRWAEEILPYGITTEELREYACAAEAEPLTALIGLVRSEVDAVGLLDASDCITDSRRMDYREHILLLQPWIVLGFKEAYIHPDFQFFYAKDGHGTNPCAAGRGVYGCFLKDGEKCRYRRADFLGIADPACLPEWAADALNQIRKEN